MPCKDYLPLVEKLADGEATPAERREAEAHLGACEDCREHFHFLEALPAAARKMSPGEPPEIYWDALPRKIMTRIGRLEGRERHSLRRRHFGLFSPSGLRWAGAVAAAVVAAVMGLRVLDVPFTGQGTSQDALQRPSAAPVGEIAESGKADQPMVGNRLRYEEQPAGEASSDRSFPEPQEGQPDGVERRAAPSHPAGKLVAAPSAPAPDEPPGLAGVEERDSPSRAEQFADDGNEALQKTQAAGETGQVTLDESESHEPEREGTARDGGRFEARRLDAPDQPPSSTTPPASGLRASRTRPDQPDQEAAGSFLNIAPAASTRSAEEGYRTLLERYPLGSTVSAEAVEETAASKEGASQDRARECADWRQFVDEHGGSEQETSARYRLALCSIALYELQSSDDNRRQAVTDGQSFLAQEPSGDRANAIRRGLERIER
ncbi:MAG: zf-HC2 domain-containing protein [Vicinamibacteria bacterium]